MVALAVVVAAALAAVALRDRRQRASRVADLNDRAVTDARWVRELLDQDGSRAFSASGNAMLFAAKTTDVAELMPASDTLAAPEPEAPSDAAPTADHPHGASAGEAVDHGADPRPDGASRPAVHPG